MCLKVISRVILRIFFALSSRTVKFGHDSQVRSVVSIVNKKTILMILAMMTLGNESAIR